MKLFEKLYVITINYITIYNFRNLSWSFSIVPSIHKNSFWELLENHRILKVYSRIFREIKYRIEYLEKLHL